GLDSACRQRLVRDTGTIVHAAAELELDGELEKLRRINVEGVRSLLDLAHQVDQDHGLERFAHVSTAYVAGGRTGVVAEGDLTDAHGFSNSYEKTKFEGESLVRASGLRLSVFRPGMVVGDAETGEIRAFNTVYVPLRLYLAGRLPLVPARRDMLLNVVPVDYVAEVISKLAFDPRAEGQTFHLTVSREHLPTAGDMLEAARGWAARNLEGAPALPRFIPIRGAERLASVRRWGVPPALLSYFQEDRSYRRDNVDRLLGPYRPDWDLILPRLLAFAAAKGFLRTTHATVHEQTLARLQSRRIPVRVHDIGAGGELHDRSGNDISAEVEAATGALKALGIARGDRVAILGLNSSRFLSLDTAIGLCGAVSVPLYYTS
ncbi:MAG TPA: SDR family oxidoreductase, partial [bacterium]|nr:SDR family oxidoreductase [bacterium]